ncbi:MAG: prepilin peptidase [Eubacterium sp.]|nr:prepilin peptidase [Eubacterium sp.]
MESAVNYDAELMWLSITIILARIIIELIFFAIGVSVFSFLNVIIYRLPRKMQFTLGNSMCTTCHHKLVSKDLIPIISWISLKGRCRYCGEKISPRYMIVEFIGGIAAVLWTMIFGIKLKALIAFLITAIAVTILYIIYDKIKEQSNKSNKSN